MPKLHVQEKKLEVLKTAVSELRNRARNKTMWVGALSLVLAISLVIALADFYDVGSFPEPFRDFGEITKRLPAWALGIVLTAIAGAATGLYADARNDDKEAAGLETEIVKLSGEINTLKVDDAKREFAYPGRPLKRGHPAGKSDHVAKLQLLLATCGFPTGVDGYFGTKTEDSVNSCQNAMGIPRNGQADRATWESLLNRVTTVQSTEKLRDGFRLFKTPVVVAPPDVQSSAPPPLSGDSDGRPSESST